MEAAAPKWVGHLLALSNQKALLAAQTTHEQRHMLKARFHFQQGVRWSGTHRSVGEFVFCSLLLSLFLIESEQNVVRW